MMYPYEQWARQNLRIKSDSGVEWNVYCLNPDHRENNPSCYFNVEEGVWYCFSCHARGTINNDPEEYAEMRLEVLKARLRRMMNPGEDKEQTVIPETMLRRYNVQNSYWAVKRGIYLETQEMFELGFDTIANAATIPVRTATGALVGVTRRFLDEQSVNSKYKYPKGFATVRNVFASWLSEDYDMTTVYKTEGAIDAMRLWQLGYPAVAFYGNSVSEEQVRTLQEMGVRKFVDASDNDKGGLAARERSFGFWERGDGTYMYKPSTDLSKHFRMMTLRDYSGHKDIGAMTDEQIIKAVESAERHRIHKYVPKKKPQKSNRRTLACV
jgi:DNA primase